MKYWTYALLLTSSLMISTPALATNDLILRNPDDLSNLARIDIVGRDNSLMIDQTSLGTGAANSITVSLTGDNNGGPLESSFSGVAAQSGLVPGQLIQRGFGNSVAVSVEGDSNLFSFSQLGNNNNIQATMIGYANEAAVSQIGNGNFAYLSQNGVGNSVNIRQVSY